MEWADDVVERVVAALDGVGDPDWALSAERYMKHVAPFLGVRTPVRRRLVRAALVGVEPPTSDELGTAAMRLARLPEREYHYAGHDVIDRFVRFVDATFLADWVEPLMCLTPSWDTVDSLGSVAVKPLARHADVDALIDRWSESGNLWLIRAAIQHQRGFGDDTDVSRALELCDRHWPRQEFFIAKAIGWALRDLSALDPGAVRRFLTEHPTPNRVATREAERGLARHSPTVDTRTDAHDAIDSTAAPAEPRPADATR